MVPKTDAVLVAEALSGQREAFTALVRRHQDDAYGVAVCVLSNFHLAQDVVQESLLCAYRDLGKLRDPERFGVWLCGIVRFTAYGILRERERLRLMAEDLSLAACARVPLPDETIIEAEQRQLVRRALRRLDRKQRQVVGLHYFGSMPYRNIAALLEVSETTVKGRLQHARARLRKELNTESAEASLNWKGARQNLAAGDGDVVGQEEAGWMPVGSPRDLVAGKGNAAEGSDSSWMRRRGITGQRRLADSTVTGDEMTGAGTDELQDGQYGTERWVTRNETKDDMPIQASESQTDRRSPSEATMPLAWKAWADKRRVEEFDAGGERCVPTRYPLAA